ncbi:MAG: hypothetical protein ACP5UI_01330 [Thermoprotei archaeon]|nr:hypothetical protein [TACK group archaeon]
MSYDKAEDNPLLMIRTALAELSLHGSLQEIPEIPGFAAHSRLYSYEGYTAVFSGSSWKLLSGIALSPSSPVISAGSTSRDIEITHEAYVVNYKLEGPELVVSFRGSIDWVVPLVEIRDVYSKGSSSTWAWDGRTATVISGPHGFTVDLEAPPEPLELTLQLKYPNGSGFRESFPPRPVSELHSGQTLFKVRGKDGLQLRFRPVPDVQVPFETQQPEQLPQLFPELSQLEGLGQALLTRTRSLFAFGVACDGQVLPDAGAWWFRQVWARDLYQGLLFNVVTLRRSPWGKALLWDALRKGLLLFDPMQLLPGRLCPVSGYGDNVDSFPLMLILGSELLSLEWRDEYARALASVANAFVSTKRSGNGRLEHDMVLSTPWASWWDSRVYREGVLVSTRLPEGWVDRSSYVLPEANALYAVAFAQVSQVAEKVHMPSAALRELSGRIVTSLKGISQPYLPMIYDPLTGSMDRTPTSTAMMAHALLGRLQQQPVFEIWRSLVEPLLVKRRSCKLLPDYLAFGVKVRPGPSPYLGDEQYHGGVVWPRDTPYLIELASKLDMRLVRELLLSNLDAGLCDGAIGYVPELYSVERGVPFPELVPVKNPAQFWSLWMDPYLDNLDLLKEQAAFG